MESASVSQSVETKFKYGPSHYIRRYGAWGLAVLNVSLFFVVWQIFASAEIVSPLFLPTVTDIISALRESWSSGELPEAILWSVRAFVIGMAIACLVGIPLGLLMGASKVAYTILSPYMWSMQSLPRVAIMPLLILIMGFDVKAELMLIFVSAVFPIMVNCLSGVQTVEPSLVRAGKVFGARKFEIYRRIIFPYTLPFIIAGVNQGMSRGLVGMVIAEIFGGNNGLGYMVQRAGEEFNSALLYGILIVLVVVALSFVQTMRWLEVKAAPWRHQGQAI